MEPKKNLLGLHSYPLTMHLGERKKEDQRRVTKKGREYLVKEKGKKIMKFLYHLY